LIKNKVSIIRKYENILNNLINLFGVNELIIGLQCLYNGTNNIDNGEVTNYMYSSTHFYSDNNKSRIQES